MVETVNRRRLQAAVIGTGFVGPHHVDAVRRGGYADVVALAGSNRARTEERARQLAVPRAVTDLTEIFGDESIDVVHVCTPNDTHVEIATRALEAGKHVVVEKPVALTLAEARRLSRLAEERERHAAVAFTYRGYPMVRRARRLVAEGEIGTFRLAHGTYLQDWLLEETDYNWRLETGAGGASRAVADIGSHWFDTTEFVSGERVDQVFADLATFLPTRRRPSSATGTFQAAGGESEPVRIETEDVATMLVRFRGGARGSCVVSQVSPGHKNDFRIELAGARRSVAWAQEEPNMLRLGARAEGTIDVPRDPDSGDEPGTPALPAGHPEGWSEALRDLFRTVYRAIVEDQPAPEAREPADYPTLSDGARAVAFVEAALRSSREGRWIEIEEA